MDTAAIDCKPNWRSNGFSMLRRMGHIGAFSSNYWLGCFFMMWPNTTADDLQPLLILVVMRQNYEKRN